MIGTQPTGALGAIEISAVTHEGLRVTVNGRPAVLAIVLDGQVVASGAEVAREAQAVAVNCYRETLKGRGHLRVVSAPIQAMGAIAPAGTAANADQSSEAA
jgi:hypothetical protein